MVTTFLNKSNVMHWSNCLCYLWSVQTKPLHAVLIGLAAFCKLSPPALAVAATTAKSAHLMATTQLQ